MLRRTLRPALAALAAVALTVMAGGQLAAQAEPTGGPPYKYTTELMGQFALIPLKNAAMLTRTEHGYLFRAGQQDSHLVITQVPGGVRFRDTGTRELRKLAPACRQKTVKVGIAAVCKVPTGVSVSQPLLLEVWPRLGDDYVDGSTLSAKFAMTVLADKGDDVALLGAGPDFFNGAPGHDRVLGGAGNDWIRAGEDADRAWGGPGADYLVGGTGSDMLDGQDGDDWVGGGDNNDRLYAGAGADLVNCSAGTDAATVDKHDRALSCEAVKRN